MLEIQAELVQENNEKAELPQVKNKLVVYFTQLPQRKYKRMNSGRAVLRGRKKWPHASRRK